MHVFICLFLICQTGTEIATGDVRNGARFDATSEAESTSRTKVLSQTLGGMQFWADEVVFHDWRIQRNVITQHYRLLDGDDVRIKSGTHASCQARF